MESYKVTNLCFFRWLGDKESACQYRRCRRLGFDPWVRKIAWRRKWQPTPVFLPGESHGQGAWWTTVHGVAKNQTQLSMHAHTHLVGPSSQGDLEESDTMGHILSTWCGNITMRLPGHHLCLCNLCQPHVLSEPQYSSYLLPPNKPLQNPVT